MATVSEKYAQRNGKPRIIWGLSPPRGADLSTVKQVGADFVSPVYSPGKPVRVDSAGMAHLIAHSGDQDVIFNLAGPEGLERIHVLQGDRFTERDLAVVKNVGYYKPTELIQAIGVLNQGLEFRGFKLRALRPSAWERPWT